MVSTMLLVIIYLSFISLGLPDSLLGSAWPTMVSELNAPLWGAGILQMTTSLCTIISSLNSARLIRRFGTGRLTAMSCLLTAMALMGMSFAPHYAFLLLLCIPLSDVPTTAEMIAQLLTVYACTVAPGRMVLYGDFFTPALEAAIRARFAEKMLGRFDLTLTCQDAIAQDQARGACRLGLRRMLELLDSEEGLLLINKNCYSDSQL